MEVGCAGVERVAAGPRLPHSVSASEVCRAPARAPDPLRTAAKMLTVRVRMLDDNITLFQVQAKALGKVLFEQVCKQLNLLESDYFGLEYQDDVGVKYFVDLEKSVQRQVGLSLVEPTVQFCVKFYPADPTQLEEEYTRYLFCLQIKRDLREGHMQCNDNTAALMASYIVQAECGDFVAEDYPDPSYLSTYKFVQHQDRDLERKIMENHKKHVGQSPAVADLNLLETARRCELYGIKMHPSKDSDGVSLNLAVAHMGILVFLNYNKINTFSWAKIRKISFKRKKFLIKLHPEGYSTTEFQNYKDTVEFFFETRNECKNLWKKCVEHHGFFRCSSVKRVQRQRPRVLSRGSSFRYSGRTQKEIVEYVRENYVKRQTFQRSSPLSRCVVGRSQSFRTAGSIHSSVANVGASISAHPLIPVGDPALVSAGSCGSMAGAAVAGSPSQICPAALTTPIPSSRQPAHLTGGVTESEDGDSLVLMNGHNVASVPPLHSTPKINGTLHSECTSPELSPMKSYKDLNKTDSLDSTDVKRKRFVNDRAYFIAKEFLMTERTYKKDLEVLHVFMRDEMQSLGWNSVSRLLELIEPLHGTHVSLLRDAEARLASWDARTPSLCRVADLFLSAANNLHLYDEFLREHQSLLTELNKELLEDPDFEEAYSKFERLKLCYLPVSRFILKPIQRLVHYQYLINSLIKFYSRDHPEYDMCESVQSKLSPLMQDAHDILNESENYIHLVELGRDLSGFEGPLAESGRQFIRQGSLAKFSQRKGFQQRMFFLFSDILVLSNLRGRSFKLQGTLPLATLTVQHREDNPTPHSFILYSQNRAVTVSASCEAERDAWLEDVARAVEEAKDRPHPPSPLLKCSVGSSSDDVGVAGEAESGRATPQRSNTTPHVCWHRNTSLCRIALQRAAPLHLSGYLLRKFKNTNGWQKLWVVFTNFCLFFYKTFLDEAPLASLPLLGYSVTTPSDKDSINKDYVFKLQFKNHVYFFRAESEYTFGRWMEVIGTATRQSHITNGVEPHENGVL